MPLAVTASRSLELPVDAPLFADPESRVVVLTNSDGEAPAVPGRVVIERQAGESSTWRSGCAMLRERYGVRALLFEGGPTLLAAMIERAAGGRAVPLTALRVLVGRRGRASILGGPLGDPVGLELLRRCTTRATVPALSTEPGPV